MFVPGLSYWIAGELFSDEERGRSTHCPGTIAIVASRASDIPHDPAVVVLNPDDVVTPETFAAWLDQRQRGEPLDPGISAADTLAEIRASGEA